MAAALCVRRHTGAETLTVPATAAGTSVRQAVHVEPGDIHLKMSHGGSVNNQRSVHRWTAVTATHHWVAGLEDLAEQDGASPLRERLSERTESAGVSDISAAHTLDTHTHTHHTDY